MAAVSERTCKNCGAPLQEQQDWCLSCGAGQPGSLAASRGWRAGATVLALAALLVAGASVAAYAALTKPSAKPRKALAQRPATGVPGTSAVPGGAATTPTTPGGATAPGTPTTIKATPPKIPLQTPTPKAAEPSDSALFPPETTKATKTGSSGKSGSGTSKSSPGSGAGQGGGETGEAGQTGETGGEGGQGGESGEAGQGEPPSPVLLDTNAARTYDPYSYPATMFGDPSLAIDGEASTVWTAAVDAAKAPNMADGLVLDMRTPQKLKSATIKTSTLGTLVEMYGANGPALPTSIADPAWKRLSGAKTLKKRSSTVKLKGGTNGYRYILLWLVKAPGGASSVAIRELELFA
jgi:hypothetical protein